MQEIFRRAHNNKRQYFIEPLRSVRCKRECVWRRFCPVRSFNHSCRRFFFLSGRESRYALKFQIEGSTT